MKSRPLPPTEELKAFLDYDPETGIFTRIKTTGSRAKAGKQCATTAPNGYMHVNIGQRRYMLHRLAWLFMTDQDPGDLEVDHINRNKADNRFVNLRLVTSQINKINCGMRSHNTSGFRGVSWCKVRGKWRASMSHMGNHVFLGYHDCIECAKAAYDEAALRLRGCHAITNAMLEEAVK